MLARVSSRWRQVAYAVGLALITAALAWVAYRAMFSLFDVPDDDGYLLMSLRKFDAGGTLYHGVYSQYGPGVFVLVGSALRAAGVALTTDGARDYNLFLWIASTLLTGLALLRLTRKFFVSAAGLAVAFLLLKADANEPLHPGATIGFLLILLVTVAVYLLPRHPRAALAGIGAIGAALLSIKVNVGVFALLASAYACVMTIPELRRHRLLRWASSALLIVLPFLLLSEHLSDATTLRFAAIVSLGVVGIAMFAEWLPAATVPDRRAIAAFVAGAAVVVLVVSIVPIIDGTSIAQLAEGWVIRPAKTPELQYVPLLVSRWMWVWAVGILAVAVVVRLLAREPGPRGTATRLAAAVLRTLAGILIWVSIVGPIFHLPTELTQSMVVGAPLLWVAMLDPAGPSSESSFIRLLVPALASLQFLHAYPVPGSQLYWASFLLVVVAGICVADGADELLAVAVSWRPSWKVWPAVIAVPVIVFGAWLVLKPLRTEVKTVKATYNSGVPLDLPGAHQLRVSEPLKIQLTELTEGLKQNCKTFLTIPGMNTLNIFAGEEPPVETSGPWPFFFTDQEEREIVAKVKRIPHFCVVSKPDLLAFWSGFSSNEVATGPLVSYYEEDFRLLHDYSGYELLVRKGERPGV